MNLWKPIKANGKRECPECTNSYPADKTGTHAVAAHFDYGTQPRRWCPGGAPPADPSKRTAPIGGRPRAA